MEKDTLTKNETTKPMPRPQPARPPQVNDKNLEAQKNSRENQGPTESSGHAKHTEDGTIEENQEEQAP